MTTEWMRRRTPKSIVGLAAVAAAAGAFWVSSLAAQDDAKKPAVPEVLARVGDQAIGRDAVIEEASKSLKDVEAERLQCQQAADRNEHEALKLAVERVVHRRILALEAERRGMTEDALREELKAQTGEVTDADVDAFYEANKAQIQQPKEQIAPRIREYLKQQRLAEGRRRLLRRAGEELQGRLPARAAAGRGGRHRPGAAVRPPRRSPSSSSPTSSAPSASACCRRSTRWRRSTATRCGWSSASSRCCRFIPMRRRPPRPRCAPTTRASSGRCTTCCSTNSRS